MPSTYLQTCMPVRRGVIDDMDIEAAVWVDDEVIRALAKALATAAAAYGLSPGELGLSIRPDKAPAAFARVRGEHEAQLAEMRAREPVVVRSASRSSDPLAGTSVDGSEICGEV